MDQWEYQIWEVRGDRLARVNDEWTVGERLQTTGRTEQERDELGRLPSEAFWTPEWDVERLKRCPPYLDVLPRAGKEGWELVSAVRDPQDTQGKRHLRLFFKRRLMSE